MFCPKCGNILPDNAKTCDACGASIGETQSNSYTTYQQQTSYTKPVPKIGFGQAVSCSSNVTRTLTAAATGANTGGPCFLSLL